MRKSGVSKPASRSLSLFQASACICAASRLSKITTRPPLCSGPVEAPSRAIRCAMTTNGVVVIEHLSGSRIGAYTTTTILTQRCAPRTTQRRATPEGTPWLWTLAYGAARGPHANVLRADARGGRGLRVDNTDGPIEAGAIFDLSAGGLLRCPSVGS